MVAMGPLRPIQVRRRSEVAGRQGYMIRTKFRMVQEPQVVMVRLPAALPAPPLEVAQVEARMLMEVLRLAEMAP